MDFLNMRTLINQIESQNTKKSGIILKMSTRIYSQMKKHVQSELPLEACGLLGGKVDGQTICAQKFFQMKNILSSRIRYRMDPLEQFKAFMELEATNLKLVAIYHSHPSGPVTPSIIDVQEAYYPDSVYLIWSNQTNHWRLFGYQILKDSFQDILIELM